MPGRNHLFLSFALTSMLGFVRAFIPSNVTCTESSLHDLRIRGCVQPPCTIRKGEPLPFEIDMSFDMPTEPSDSVYFNVYLPKYAVPPSTHGTKLITATCEQENLGLECPITPDEKHTIKSTLFVQADAICTGNCDGLGKKGTGLRETKWRWAVSNSQMKKNRKHAKDPKRAYSVCTFKVTLNIVE